MLMMIHSSFGLAFQPILLLNLKPSLGSCKAFHNRLANLRVGQLLEIGNGAIFGSMITYMRLVKMGQKSQAFLTQMVQFWWGNCVSLKQNG